MTSSLTNDVASKSKKQKKLEIFSFTILKIARSGAESESVSQRCGSGFVPKCHGSATNSVLKCSLFTNNYSLLLGHGEAVQGEGGD
jgi:hypothetical protein